MQEGVLRLHRILPFHFFKVTIAKLGGFIEKTDFLTFFGGVNVLIPPITTEDKDIAADYIILHLLKKTLEKDIEAIEASTIRLQIPLRTIIRQLNLDIKETRRSMQTKGIKVFEREVINEDIWRYPYDVRGYEGEFRFWTAALRRHMQKRFTNYLGLHIEDDFS